LLIRLLLQGNQLAREGRSVVEDLLEDTVRHARKMVADYKPKSIPNSKEKGNGRGGEKRGRGLPNDLNFPRRALQGGKS